MSLQENPRLVRLVSSIAPAKGFAYTHVFEWTSSIAMIGIGIEIWLSRGLAFRAGSFRMISQLGLSDWIYIAFFLIVGVMRCVALYLNGSLHPYGPIMRTAGALLAALIWSQLGVALLLSLLATKTMNIGIALYCALVMGELFSCYRAGYDAGRRAH